MPEFWENYPKTERSGVWYGAAVVNRRFGYKDDILVAERKFTSVREAYLYARLRALLVDYLYIGDRLVGRGVSWRLRGVSDRLELVQINYLIETEMEFQKILEKRQNNIPVAIRKLYMVRGDGKRELLDRDCVSIHLEFLIPTFYVYNQIREPMTKEHVWSEETAGEPNTNILIHLH